MPDMPPQALVAWLAIVPLAIANGIVREKLLMPAAGVVAGNLLSGTILSALIVLVAIAGTSLVRAVCPVGDRRRVVFADTGLRVRVRAARGA